MLPFLCVSDMITMFLCLKIALHCVFLATMAVGIYNSFITILLQAPLSASKGYFTFPLGGLLAELQLPCPLGSYCLNGAAIPCPAGRYGKLTQLSTPSCTGTCNAGFYCPAGSTSAAAVPCGSNAVYCGGGTGAPVPADPGYYTLGGSNDGTARTGEALCLPGTYCAGGVEYECPDGTYGDVSGLASPACAGLCSAGFVCPAGSFSNESQPCPVGSYCPPGAQVPCPRGTYSTQVRSCCGCAERT